MHEVERAVERVIQSIHENYGEQLTIDDMARTAMYSKFHFTRIFQRVTGLTPGRFLSAVRLQKAKQLLTGTSLKVTDISHMVGYTSVGTFSSRFGYSVGVPPTTYRQLGGFRPWSAGDGPDPEPAIAAEQAATIRGNVSFQDAGNEGPVFVGLFPGPSPQGRPVRSAVVHLSGAYALEDVPEGDWYVIACAPSERPAEPLGGHAGPSREPALLAGNRLPYMDQALSIGINGPISIRQGTVRLADVRLRPQSVLDPPVLVALPRMRPEMLAAREDGAA
jgi:AraC-like DNA-binding protein